jgi:hypothetical protein
MTNEFICSAKNKKRIFRAEQEAERMVCFFEDERIQFEIQLIQETIYYLRLSAEDMVFRHKIYSCLTYSTIFVEDEEDQRIAEPAIELYPTQKEFVIEELKALIFFMKRFLEIKKMNKKANEDRYYLKNGYGTQILPSFIL